MVVVVVVVVVVTVATAVLARAPGVSVVFGTPLFVVSGGMVVVFGERPREIVLLPLAGLMARLLCLPHRQLVFLVSRFKCHFFPD